MEDLDDSLFIHVTPVDLTGSFRSVKDEVKDESVYLKTEKNQQYMYTEESDSSCSQNFKNEEQNEINDWEILGNELLNDFEIFDMAYPLLMEDFDEIMSLQGCEENTDEDDTSHVLPDDTDHGLSLPHHTNEMKYTKNLEREYTEKSNHVNPFVPQTKKSNWTINIGSVPQSNKTTYVHKTEELNDTKEDTFVSANKKSVINNTITACSLDPTNDVDKYCSDAFNCLSGNSFEAPNNNSIGHDSNTNTFNQLSYCMDHKNYQSDGHDGSEHTSARLSICSKNISLIHNSNCRTLDLQASCRWDEENDLHNTKDNCINVTSEVNAAEIRNSDDTNCEIAASCRSDQKDDTRDECNEDCKCTTVKLHSLPTKTSLVHNSNDTNCELKEPHHLDEESRTNITKNDCNEDTNSTSRNSLHNHTKKMLKHNSNYMNCEIQVSRNSHKKSNKHNKDSNLVVRPARQSLRRRLDGNVESPLSQKSCLPDATYTCSVCNKTFKRKDHLKDHTITHMDQRPFACSICPKSFKRRASLVNHNLTHTGERPYICFVCDRSYNHVSKLRVHERLHTGERPYLCSMCDKSFNRMDSLKVHERSHTDENRPHVCSVCNKRFKEVKHLKEHYVIHSGECKYECSACGDRFIRLRALKRHFSICESNKTQRTDAE